MTVTAPTGFDPSVLGEADWAPRSRGRTEEASPYLPAVQYAVENPPAEGKSYTLKVQLEKEKDNATEPFAKSLLKHRNLLFKAGRQATPEVTVMVQAGDISKTGQVTFSFKTRDKVTRPRKAKAETAAE
jgi:hypothetical protein